jgi:hypothetical protein
MGITIHYRGTLANINEIGVFVEELTDIAETMKWPYSEALFKQKHTFLNGKIEQVAQALETAEEGDTSGYSPEEMLDMIENILMEKLGSDNLDAS